MIKEQTVGSVGETLFINFLKKNNIKFTDLRDHKKVKIIKINGRNKQGAYSCLRILHTHPFDLVINKLNIEIKTSTLHKWDNKVTFGWLKNDRKNIDYVVGIVINKENKILNFLLFNNNYVNVHPAFSARYNDKLTQIIAKKELIKLLTV